MGRKTIPPNLRAQPISFSLKPHLIAKIDEYCNDLRFNRSKFLMQAVTEYMTRHVVHGTNLSSDLRDMTLTQKVAVGLAALQEANREGETISKSVIDELRKNLKMNKDIEDQKRLDDFMDTFHLPEKKPELTIEKVRAGEHQIYLDGMVAGYIEKDPADQFPWTVLIESNRSTMDGGIADKCFKTYHEAVRYVRYYWG